MIYSVDFRELAGKIKHVVVAKYLHDLGWSEIPSRRESVKIFQTECKNDFFQIDLPVSRDLRDYNAAMYSAMEIIAQSNKKSVEQVILELLNPLSDVLRLRIKEPDIEAGSILFEDAIQLYDSAKKLLMATAMDVVRPQLYHVGRPENSIVEFINSCRFGQTEIGSYVVSIVCPISKIDKNQFVQLSIFNDADEGAQSLTRKVVNKLITSVDKVKAAINKGNLDDFIDDNVGTSDNVSANFLDALSSINIYRNDSTLDIMAIYAPTIRGNRLSNTAVSIDHDYYMPIDTLAKKYKIVQESEKTYFGMVKKLDAPPDPSARKHGNVSIVFLDDNQKAALASVVLSPENYDAAIEAHRLGKTVKVIGTMTGQSHKNIACSYFEVLG